MKRSIQYVIVGLVLLFLIVWIAWSAPWQAPVAIIEITTETEAISFSELQDDIHVVFDQSMMLINTEHMLSDYWILDISEYKESGVYMNDCMHDAYAALSAAVYVNTGKRLHVSSHFRTAEKQAFLYAQDPNTATLPRASEHQSGLCVDVYVAGYAGDAFIRSPAGRYVNRNAYRYGFIIRYPFYGENITGIRYEPWHIRYVGAPHAEIVHTNRITLEEYILGLEIGQWYKAQKYLICRQAADENGCLQLPQTYESAVISWDNTGYYIVTVKM